MYEQPRLVTNNEEVIKNIIEEFSLSDEEAEKYMKMYW